MQTRLVNQLTTYLKAYYPVVLSLSAKPALHVHIASSCRPTPLPSRMSERTERLFLHINLGVKARVGGEEAFDWISRLMPTLGTNLQGKPAAWRVPC